MYLNKALIIGNLTRDPELKALPSGGKVCTFSIATNRTWKDQSGVKKEAVDYHNIVVFGRQAETTAQYLKKGSSALIEGRLQTRSWDDKDGSKKYRTEIVADRVQFGNKPGGASGSSGGGFSGGSVGGASSSVAGSGNGSSAIDSASGSDKDAIPSDAIEYPEEEINPDDIPF